ncbi:MAG TPA: hypothetical protein VNT42_07545 [Sphingomonas sp.]|nr:hypothetical protein [Sphingomonas sp.]
MTYRQIVPATDVMYRYRMTGKASALGSRVKFESGMLDAAAIDPFGSDAVYREEIGGYVVRSAEDAKAELAAKQQAAAAVRQTVAALGRYHELAELELGLAAREDAATGAAKAAITAQRATVQSKMVEALGIYLGTLSTGADLKVALQPLQDDLTAIKDKVTAALLIKPVDDAAAQARAQAIATATAHAVAAKLETIVDKAKANDSTKPSGPSGLCPADSILRHGFQLMGPEGMIPYDQSKRLIMAMHTSADPLIDTLQEYAGRLLKDKPNQAEQLLPLVRESFRVVEGQRSLAQMSAALGGTTQPSVKDIAKDLIAAFDPDGAGKPKEVSQ